jgi:hypothetical protein
MELDEATVSRILQEFSQLDLGDPRRTRRVLETISKLARRPNQSLPLALETLAAREGAYRILNNKHFDYDDLLETHREQTITRAQQAGEVLVLHDTTTCRLEHADPREIGYLPTGKAGFFAHVGLVVDANSHRRPLGALHVEPYWRDRRSGRGGRKKHLSGREVAQWEGRESERWARGVQVTQEQLDGCQVIHVMDREADKYELFVHLRQHEERFVIRSSHDRRLASESSTKALRATLHEQAIQLQREVHVSRRKAPTAPRSVKLTPARPARCATLNVTAASVVLRRPNTLTAKFPAKLALNAVSVLEQNPPTGQKPISWYLLTSEPIDTPEQIERIIDIYRYRWLIEELFKALKTGCVYQERLLECRHAWLNLLVMSLPIAVELLWLRSRVWDAPQASAEEVVTPRQIEVLRAMGERPVPKNPTALQVLLAIAGLGGHIKQNGHPGWNVLGRGYQRLLDYEAGWVAAKAAPKKRNL